MPLLHYLMIDGAGKPNTSTAYREAVEALFTVSYTLKFMIKNGPKSVDYVVLPLEGLWWSDDMNDFVRGNKDNWKWTAMILQPEFITHELFETAKHDAAKKKKLAALDLIRLEAFSEGLCAQTLFIGPYNEEGPAIAHLHNFIGENGYVLTGKHHEIYLNDFEN